MMQPIVVVKRDGPVAIVTMNRPEALNALSRALRAEIVRVFGELAEDDSVRVAVLTGAGRAFTAGVDLKEAGQTGFALGADEDSKAINMAAALEAYPWPIIGAINGFAITGGFELALMCDVLLASEHAKFADTHARVGIVPGWGLSQRRDVTEADAAFPAGIALKSLDDLVRSEPAWAACWPWPSSPSMLCSASCTRASSTRSPFSPPCPLRVSVR